MGVFSSDGTVSVEWDREKPLFTAGDTIRATVTYIPKKDMTIRGVTVHVAGLEHTFYEAPFLGFMQQHSVPVFDETVVTPEMARDMLDLSSADSTMTEGKAYRFPFEYTLPCRLPWSVHQKDPYYKDGHKQCEPMHTNGFNAVRYLVWINVEHGEKNEDPVGVPFYILPPEEGRYPSEGVAEPVPAPLEPVTTEGGSVPFFSNKANVKMT
eukprot:g5014.t1